MTDRIEFFLNSLQISDQEKCLVVRLSIVENALLYLKSDERIFESLLPIIDADKRDYCKERLKTIINNGNEYVDMFIHYNNDPDSCPEYIDFIDNDKDNDYYRDWGYNDDEGLIDLSSNKAIPLFIWLEQSIITYAEKALSAIETFERIQQKDSNNSFFKRIILYRKDLDNLRKAWIRDCYIEEISSEVFDYYFCFGLSGGRPQIKIKWKRSRKELVIFLKELSTNYALKKQNNNTPEWNVAEKVFEGVNRHVLKSTMHRLKPFYSKPEKEIMDEDVEFIRDWLQENVY